MTSNDDTHEQLSHFGNVRTLEEVAIEVAAGACEIERWLGFHLQQPNHEEHRTMAEQRIDEMRALSRSLRHLATDWRGGKTI